MAKPVDVRTNFTRDDVIYLAGYIDGDGSFYAGRVKQGKYGNGWQFHIKLIVTSCDREPIAWMRETFGGNAERQARPAANRPHDRIVYQWVATGPLLDHVLPLICPFLKNKKRQCELFLEMRKTFQNIGSKRLPQETVDRRTDLISQIRKINSSLND